MEEKPPRRRRNPVVRFVCMLVEARWFFAMSASMVATVTGISLTFGINSCRENRRVRHEMQKSMLQAVDNLDERFADTREWVEIIEGQNGIYLEADELYKRGEELSDSLCTAFRNTLPFVRLAAYDHDFEKIFRGSYQLWQVQSAGDSLAYFIGECYDGLNVVEKTCEELTGSLIDAIGDVLAKDRYWEMDDRLWTLTLLESPAFQYYMSIRRYKTFIAAGIFDEAHNDFTTNVVPRARKLNE